MTRYQFESHARTDRGPNTTLRFLTVNNQTARKREQYAYEES